MDDCIEQPIIVDGLMEPLKLDSGFGNLINLNWISEQQVYDPDGLLEDL